MANGKYIVFSRLHDIIIFPNNITHRDMTELLRQSLGAPLSAGFIQQIASGEDDYLLCYGESSSLKLKSRPHEDSILADKALGILDDYDPIPECLRKI